MSENKRQHYVPKFYLKLFSVNNENTQIGLFNFKHNIFKSNVSLSPQAQGEYFYGEDGVIEKALSEIETAAAPAVKDIIANNKLPVKNTPDYTRLYVFSVMLGYRTIKDADEVNAVATDILGLLIDYDDDLTEEEKNRFKTYKLVRESPGEIPVSVMIQKLHLGYDLKAKLILNKTDQKLIISDNPVVRYNQFLEQRKHHGGNDGIATKGLQLFVPISPNHLIVFYDEWVYKIGDKKSDIIELKNREDVNSLNMLQLANCSNQIYFNHEISETYISNLTKKTKRIPVKDNGKMKLTYAFIDNENNERFNYHAAHNCVSTNLELSFITLTKKAKNHILNRDEIQIRNSVEKIQNQFHRNAQS